MYLQAEPRYLLSCLQVPGGRGAGIKISSGPVQVPAVGAVLARSIPDGMLWLAKTIESHPDTAPVLSRADLVRFLQ